MRNEKHWALDVTLVLVLLCQVGFLLTLVFHDVYLTDFPDYVLSEYFSLAPLTQVQQEVLGVYKVAETCLLLACYGATLYIRFSRTYREEAKAIHFGGVMLAEFFLAFFIRMAVRSAYVSIALNALGTEVYALALLYFVLRLKKRMTAKSA